MSAFCWNDYLWYYLLYVIVHVNALHITRWIWVNKIKDGTKFHLKMESQYIISKKPAAFYHVFTFCVLLYVPIVTVNISAHIGTQMNFWGNTSFLCTRLGAWLFYVCVMMIFWLMIWFVCVQVCVNTHDHTLHVWGFVWALHMFALCILRAHSVPANCYFCTILVFLFLFLFTSAPKHRFTLPFSMM